MGGSADLAPSNKTEMKGEGDFSKENYAGRNLHFGVRELAMGAIANGLALHGGVKPFVATFFVFSDYVKPMARLAALMKLPVTYVMTHDSIGVGEDGPTHRADRAAGDAACHAEYECIPARRMQRRRRRPGTLRLLRRMRPRLWY